MKANMIIDKAEMDGAVEAARKALWEHSYGEDNLSIVTLPEAPLALHIAIAAAFEHLGIRRDGAWRK